MAPAMGNSSDHSPGLPLCQPHGSRTRTAGHGVVPIQCTYCTQPDLYSACDLSDCMEMIYGGLVVAGIGSL